MRPEHWVYTIPLRLRSLFRRRQADQELEDELRDHVEQKTEEYIARGLDPGEARRQALLEMGGVEKRKEECRDARRVNWIQDLAQDIRFALRMLRKSPGFTAVAILTLALGIGANTAIFSFIDGVLLRSLPVKEPQQLVLFSWSARQKPRANGRSAYGDCYKQELTGDCSFPLPFFKTLRSQADSFSGMAAFAGPLDVDLSAKGAASIASSTYVSGDFFSTLGVNTILGRPLVPSDDTPSAPPAIVLNYAYWDRAFGSDCSVVGRTVRLDSTTATIIGIADPQFTNLTPGKLQDFYMPFSLADRIRGEWWSKNDTRATDASVWWVVMLGRLKPGVSIGRAQASASTIFRNVMLHGARPAFQETDAPSIALTPAQAGLNGETSDWAPPLYISMALVGFILLIACANVAGLTLARSATRQKEMAVRLALGAGRARLIRQLLTESLLLSLAGGLVGFLLAYWRIGGMVGIISSDRAEPFPFVISPDWRVLTFAVAVTFITGILFGLAPAMRGSRIDLTPSLKESTSSLPGGAAHAGRYFRLSDGLVVAQVALSIVVLIGAGLLVRTLHNLSNLNPGFDTRNVLLFDIDPTIAGFTDRQTQQLYGNLQEHFAALPGVISVSYSEDALLDGGTSGDDIHLDGAPPKQDINTLELPVGLNFFSTMHIPILAGRAFTPADFAAAITTNAADKARDAAATPNPASSSAPASTVPSALDEAYYRSAPIPVLINEMFAQTFLRGQDPLGMHMGDSQATDDEVQHPGPGYTVIGIVADTRYDRPRRAIQPIMFLPLVSNSAYFELRTAANPTLLVKSVRDVVSRVADNLPLSHVRTQTGQIEDMLSQERLMSRLSTFYGAVALVLACIGLYGLLSYEVARRTREIGIRMALGARRVDVLRLVMVLGLKLTVVGAMAGIVGALALTQFLSSLLYGVSPTDPVTSLVVTALLTLVTLAACYIPARRAMRVDPMVALRYE
ncbi:MAG: ABC transporter permease [Candidatus Acidiferrum sp.]